MYWLVKRCSVVTAIEEGDQKDSGNSLSFFLASACREILKRTGRRIPRHMMTKEGQ